ncbi:MAG TPA: pentapeptide repeat-containing protein [Longimicrobium sp.]
MSTTAVPPKPRIPDDAIARILDGHQIYLKRRGHSERLRACFLGRNLSGARFVKGKSLEQAQFHGATLVGCTFEEGLDLNETDFSGADLTGADLREVENLSEQRLGASNLQYARLPDGFTFDGLATLRELSTRAERIAVALLAICATIMTVAFTMGDDKLFLPSAVLQLPVVGLPVPIRAFFYLLPWLLLALYVYLLSTAEQVWSTLRDLPAIFPNRRAVFREVNSFPNLCVMPFGTLWPNHTKRGGRNVDTAREWRRTTRWDRFTVALLVWFMVPVTIAVLWLRYLPRHDRIGTIVQVVAVVLAAGLSLRSYGMMRVHLGSGLQWLQGPGGRVRWLDAAQFSGGGAGTLLLRGISVVGADRLDLSLVRPRPMKVRNVVDNEPGWLRIWPFVVIMGVVGGIAGGASHLALTRGACTDQIGRRDEDRGICYRFAANLDDADLTGLELDAENLRRAWLRQAVLRNADLERAHLDAANLTEADLQGAILKDAELDDAVLWEASAVGANLKEADLEGADLRGADLRGARMQGVDLSGANLLGADLTGAVLCGAELAGKRGRAVITAQQRAQAIGLRFLASGGDPRWDAPSPGVEQLTILERAELRRWAEAHRRAAALSTMLRDSRDPAGTVPREPLMRELRRLDVSMGQRIEREEMRLEQAIFDHTVGGRVRLADIQEPLAEVFERITTKARNHCVAAEPISTP